MKHDLLRKFRLKESFWNGRIAKWKYSLFKRITQKSMPLYFRGQDIISITPQTDGTYDKNTIEFFKYVAAEGYSGFLIDIGANIGLISCQVGMVFREVHMFEPNPYAAHILKVNTFIALKDQKYTIHGYGLGARNERLPLHIPYDNWGGAFVRTQENAYDLQLLSEKDGYGSFNASNYQLVDVEIKSARGVLSEIFNELSNKQYTRGVIKIDVEGMDEYLIEEILTLIPRNFSFFLLFENRDASLDAEAFRIKHPRISTIYGLRSTRTKIPNAPRWLNSFIHWWKDDGYVVIEEITEKMGIGDFLIKVD